MEIDGVELWGIKDVCKLLSVSSARVYQIQKEDPDFPKGIMFSNRWLWSAREIREYANRRTDNPAAWGKPKEPIEKILDRVAAEAEAAESIEDDGAPLPPHVTVTRGHPDNVDITVTLRGHEAAMLEQLAAKRELPATTIARAAILAALAKGM